MALGLSLMLGLFRRRAVADGPAAGSGLQKEDGGFLLLETGDFILLEQ